jgi:hypothetical protein
MDAAARNEVDTAAIYRRIPPAPAEEQSPPGLRMDADQWVHPAWQVLGRVALGEAGAQLAGAVARGVVLAGEAGVRSRNSAGSTASPASMSQNQVLLCPSGTSIPWSTLTLGCTSLWDMRGFVTILKVYVASHNKLAKRCLKP